MRNTTVTKLLAVFIVLGAVAWVSAGSQHRVAALTAYVVTFVVAFTIRYLIWRRTHKNN